MNQELLKYIAEQLKNGVSREEISKSLSAGGGWSYADINAAFSVLAQTPVVPVVHTATPPAIAEPSASTALNISEKKEEDIYKEFLEKGYTVVQIQKLIDESKKEKTKGETQGKAVKTILSIAAVLIGAGIFSFIAANWSVLPDLFKLFILIATIFAFNGFGFYAKNMYGSPRLGDALFFAGSFAYGGSIFLIGQIFNIEIAWFDGFVLWMLGAALSAYLSEANANYSLFLTLSLVSLGIGTGSIINGAISPFAVKESYSISLLFCFLAFLATYLSGIFAYNKINRQLK